MRRQQDRKNLIRAWNRGVEKTNRAHPSRTSPVVVCNKPKLNNAHKQQINNINGFQTGTYLSTYTKVKTVRTTMHKNTNNKHKHSKNQRKSG